MTTWEGPIAFAHDEAAKAQKDVRLRVCSQFAVAHLIDGAGHWVQ